MSGYRTDRPRFPVANLEAPHVHRPLETHELVAVGTPLDTILARTSAQTAWTMPLFEEHKAALLAAAPPLAWWRWPLWAIRKPWRAINDPLSTMDPSETIEDWIGAACLALGLALCGCVWSGISYGWLGEPAWGVTKFFGCMALIFVGLGLLCYPVEAIAWRLSRVILRGPAEWTVQRFTANHLLKSLPGMDIPQAAKDIVIEVLGILPHSYIEYHELKAGEFVLDPGFVLETQDPATDSLMPVKRVLCVWDGEKMLLPHF